MEIMKTAMDEMRRHINEMQMQLQARCCPHCPHCPHDSHSHSHPRICDYMNGEKTVCDFGEWLNGLEFTLQDLEIMFESKDMVDWASMFIIADLKKRSENPHPLCSIKGSRNEMLVYDKNAWKKITDQEFASTIVNKLFKKIISIFTQWKNENYNRILSSEHFSTLYHSNYARILSFNENASKLKIKLFHAL
jgi:hypothetical protein